MYFKIKVSIRNLVNNKVIDFLSNLIILFIDFKRESYIVIVVVSIFIKH